MPRKKKLKKKTFPDKQAWLDARLVGISGTDAGVICGVNPWKSRYRLWAEKRGLVSDEIEITGPIEWGVILEPVVRDHYASLFPDREVTPGEELTIHYHPDHDWMIGSFDGFVENEAGEQGIYEGKTAGHFAGSKWEDEPPLHYQIQGQHYLAVSGGKFVTFAVLIGGQRFLSFDLPRNQEFIDVLVEREREFLDMVENNIEPEIDQSSSTAQALGQGFMSYRPGESVVLPDESADWDEQRVTVMSQIRELEATKEGLDNRLKAALGENEVGQVPGKDVSYSWKAGGRAKTRTFRRHEG